MKRNRAALGYATTMLGPVVMLAACGSEGASSATPPAPVGTVQAATATMGVATKAPSPDAPTATPMVIVTPVVVDSPVPQPTQGSGPPPTVAPAPTATHIPVGGGDVSLTIAAIDTEFAPSTATLPAGARVTLTFNNQDVGVIHDIVIFDPTGSTLAATDLAEGVIVQTALFTLGAPGTYSFKCSVHPREMKGFLKVQ